MKCILTAACLFVMTAAFSQPTVEEIKKFKISHITKTEKFSDSDIINITETWYDEAGQDTALFYAGERYRITYLFDKINRVVKESKYDMSGDEISNYVYTYNPDGSYQVDYWHVLADQITYEKYNSKKLLDIELLRDGSKLFYDYDNKNRLISVMTMLSPSGKGEIVNLKYTYDAKGKLQKIINKGIAAWERTYTYNIRGQIEKIDCTGNQKWTKKYYYNDKGLILKLLKEENSNTGRSIGTAEFVYEFQ